MFGLITMLVSTLGATGMGSLLKIVGGVIDRWASAKEAREKRKLASRLKEMEISSDLYAKIFGGDDAGSAFSRGTRRMLALIGVVNLFVISILCTIWPDVPLITFTLPEYREGVRFLWGIITMPSSAAMTVVITTGHMVVMTVTILASMMGFYFTPSGRK